MSKIKEAFGEALEAVGEVKEDLKELKDMASNTDWFLIFLMSTILNIILIFILFV